MQSNCVGVLMMLYLRYSDLSVILLCVCVCMCCKRTGHLCADCSFNMLSWLSLNVYIFVQFTLLMFLILRFDISYKIFGSVRRYN